MATPKSQKRAYSAAHFALELDGSDVVGVIRSVGGGGVKSEIMTYHQGNDWALWRQIAKPKYEDIKLEFSMSLSNAFYAWIQSFFQGKVERRNGAIVAGDFHYHERARRTFKEAIISEITFPTLAGGDRNAVYMSATVVPEILRFEKPAEEKLLPTVGKLNQKLWTAANFRLYIDDQGSAMSEGAKRCTKVDSFTIKQQVHEYHQGDKRDPLRVPGYLEFPNITFYLPEADAQPFIDHYTKFGIDGQRQSSPRLTGAIEMKDNAQSELCTVSLAGIDIANITTDKAEAGTDNIKEVKIEISVESMDFSYQGHGVG
ncbi:MAG: phage tail protein [Myxococcota bacterium]